MNILKLIFCLILDAIGYLTYSIPFIAELGDIIWAPIYALIIHKMFNSPIFSTIAGLEEFLPMTDFIPSATIFWVLETMGRKF